MIPNIEDLTEPPVVGQMYMVPCVFSTSWTEWDSSGGEWQPVTGPPHSDAEYINVDKTHYHYDTRFLSEAQIRTIDKGAWLFAGDPIKAIATHYTKLERRPLVCQRAVLHFKREPWSADLENGYADKRVKCGTCPHRGLPLLSLPREPGTDIVTCPGHGLRWDLKTGALVRPSANL